MQRPSMMIALRLLCTECSLCRLGHMWLRCSSIQTQTHRRTENWKSTSVVTRWYRRNFLFLRVDIFPQCDTFDETDNCILVKTCAPSDVEWDSKHKQFIADVLWSIKLKVTRRIFLYFSNLETFLWHDADDGNGWAICSAAHTKCTN